MKENRDLWLNVHGLREYTNKGNSNLTARRAYYWVDRVIIVDESEDRRVVGDYPYSSSLRKECKWEPKLTYT